MLRKDKLAMTYLVQDLRVHRDHLPRHRRLLLQYHCSDQQQRQHLHTTATTDML